MNSNNTKGNVEDQYVLEPKSKLQKINSRKPPPRKTRSATSKEGKCLISSDIYFCLLISDKSYVFFNN